MDKNEAIKIIRSNFPTGRKMLCEALEILIPELKESEDERIRKAIVNHLLELSKSRVNLMTKETYENWIAWLEKQGEHANFRNKIQIGDEVTRNEDGVLVNLSQFKRMVKQGEQKPAWSKENICYYDDICEILINLINSPKSNVNKDVVQKDLDWLRSVKESQLKPTWSEEDENGFGDTLWAIQQARTIAKNENEMGGLWYAEKWLKSLKQRMKGE